MLLRREKRKKKKSSTKDNLINLDNRFLFSTIELLAAPCCDRGMYNYLCSVLTV